MSSRNIEYQLKHILLSRNCVAIVFQKEKTDTVWKRTNFEEFEDGFSVFENFVKQNAVCFWNQCLVKSVSSLEYRGCIVPLNVIVGGTDFALEVVRSAWARRVLRPPKGYVIICLGDVSVLEMHPVPQTQFAPLSEALCKVVVELNSEQIPATASTVSAKLAESFPKMEVPSDEILYKTLGGLIKERKLYHTGKGYFVVSPDTYRQRSLSPLCERQMLMTNEEAIVRLHGQQRERTLAVQVDESDIAASWPDASSSPASSSKRNHLSSASSSSPVNQQVLPPSPDLRVVERRHSLKVMRVKGRPTASAEIFNRSNSLRESSARTGNSAAARGSESPDIQRNEKQSMFAKLFRRMQSLTDKSNKHVTFSSQYPSLNWTDSPPIKCRSVATQTLVQLRKSHARAEERRSAHLETSPQKSSWQKPNKSNEKIVSDYTNAMSFLRNMTADDNSDNTNRGRVIDGNRNVSPFFRCSAYRSSPSHRHSYAAAGCYSKRHHRHRRSSSESPKIDKVKRKEAEPTARVNELASGPKTSSIQQTQGFLHNQPRASNPKAIISPCTVISRAHSSPKAEDPAHTQTVPAGPANAQPTSTNHHLTLNKFDNQPSNDSRKVAIPSVATKICGEVRPVKPVEATKVEVVGKCNNESERSETDETETRGNSETSSEMKLSLSDSNFEIPTFNTLPRANKPIKPLNIQAVENSKIQADATPTMRKKCKPNEFTVDNCVNVEVSVEKHPKSLPSNTKSSSAATVSQTVTEETTVTKSSGNSKVVTITNITTSLSHGALKDVKSSSPESNEEFASEKLENKVNDLNFEPKATPRIIDCTSSCNIVTEVK